MIDAQQTLTLSQLREQRAEILALAEKYGAYNVRVFGSIARGEATPDSDIDLLMSFRESASLYDLSGLWQDLQNLLGRKVDILSDHPHLKERLKARIMRDAVPL